MKTTNLFAILLAALVANTFSARAWSDTFGSGANTFNIDFVTIGNPGNVADTTGNPNPAGSVAYTFRMGQFEISEQMIDKANTLGGLGITQRYARRRQAGHVRELERGSQVRELAQHERRQRAGL